MRIFLPKHNSQRLLRYTSGSFYGRDLKQLSKLAVVSVSQHLRTNICISRQPWVRSRIRRSWEGPNVVPDVKLAMIHTISPIPSGLLPNLPYSGPHTAVATITTLVPCYWDPIGPTFSLTPTLVGHPGVGVTRTTLRVRVTDPHLLPSRPASSN